MKKDKSFCLHVYGHEGERSSSPMGSDS